MRSIFIIAAVLFLPGSLIAGSMDDLRQQLADTGEYKAHCGPRCAPRLLPRFRPAPQNRPRQQPRPRPQVVPYAPDYNPGALPEREPAPANIRSDIPIPADTSPDKTVPVEPSVAPPVNYSYQGSYTYSEQRVGILGLRKKVAQTQHHYYAR